MNIGSSFVSECFILSVVSSSAKYDASFSMLGTRMVSTPLMSTMGDSGTCARYTAAPSTSGLRSHTILRAPPSGATKSCASCTIAAHISAYSARCEGVASCGLVFRSAKFERVCVNRVGDCAISHGSA